MIQYTPLLASQYWGLPSIPLHEIFPLLLSKIQQFQCSFYCKTCNIYVGREHICTINIYTKWSWKRPWLEIGSDTLGWEDLCGDQRQPLADTSFLDQIVIFGWRILQAPSLNWKVCWNWQDIQLRGNKHENKNKRTRKNKKTRGQKVIGQVNYEKEEGRWFQKGLKKQASFL